MNKELKLYYYEKQYKNLEMQLLDKKFNWDCWGIEELYEAIDKVELRICDILRIITIH